MSFELGLCAFEQRYGLFLRQFRCLFAFLGQSPDAMFGRIHPSSLGHVKARPGCSVFKCGLAVLIDMCHVLNRQPFMFSQIGIHLLGCGLPPQVLHSPVHGSKVANKLRYTVNLGVKQRQN